MMAPTQGIVDRDLEKGHVVKDDPANPDDAQRIERIDHEPRSTQVASEQPGGSISKSSSAEPLASGGEICRESISSLDGDVLNFSLPTTLPGNNITRTATAINTDLGVTVNPGEWVIKHHEKNLIFRIEKKQTPLSSLSNWLRKKPNEPHEGKWKRPDENKDFRISFAELQRMHLRKLQCKLVRHVAEMKKARKEPEGWEEDLEAYIKAVQDYDYMTKCSQRPRDPFLVTGERSIDSYVIHSTLGGSPEGDFEHPIPVDGPWEDDGQPIGGTRNVNTAISWINGFKKRAIIAAVGGLLLIAPMWLMVLHNTLYTCLVSTTVFVAAFGAIMAWYLDEPKEVMAGTAAYAAVLVVFVGLGS